MVETTHKMQGRQLQRPADPPAGTPGSALDSPRLARLQAIARANEVPHVKVEPTKDKYRKSLKHLPSGIGFQATGHAIWPMDQFTQRRIREGSVTVLGRARRPDRNPQPQPEAKQEAKPN